MTVDTINVLALVLSTSTYRIFIDILGSVDNFYVFSNAIGNFLLL